MAILNDILGINARSADYLLLNKKRARKRADDKLLTKKMLRKAKVPHPELLAVFKNVHQARDFDWSKIRGGFVIKPVQGFGGQGIVIIKKQAKEEGKYWTVDGKKVSADDLVLHAVDIIEGKYSHNNLPDKVMIEERIMIHPKFKKLAVGGAPDVRVIVFNSIPVMAMLRLPTEESAGKANLHQGAIGLGIDIATGITTHGVYKDSQVKYFPDSKKKINGISIPYWNKILLMAVKTQRVSGLGYLSVDMLIDSEKGPVVLELNDQPGLSIQLANMAGLRKRLQRVEGLRIDSAEKGVRVARALFASEFANRVKFDPSDRPIAKVVDEVMVRPAKGKRRVVRVKVDTGAYSTSVDEDLAKDLGLLTDKYLIMEKSFRSALGEQNRPLIAINFVLKGVKIKTVASVSDRSHLDYQMIIGRRDLKGFLIDPIADEKI